MQIEMLSFRMESSVEVELHNQYDRRWVSISYLWRTMFTSNQIREALKEDKIDTPPSLSPDLNTIDHV